MAKAIHLKNKKFDSLHMILLAVIFGVIGTVLILVSRAAPPPPTVYLEPAISGLGPNQEFTVQVREDSGTTPVNAVQANFSYPTSLVDYVSMNTDAGAFDTVAEANHTAGQIRIAAGVDPEVAASFTGDRLIATVTFRTKAVSGTANMTFTAGTALVRASDNQNLLASLSATGSGAYTIDATAPTVSITAPANNATISKGGSSNINITASASDNIGVTRVEFYVNGTLRNSDPTAPYEWSQATSGLPLGATTIYARAFDARGNSQQSSTVNVTLADTTAPTVSISAPASGSTVSGNSVNVTANATDESGGSGISRVEFFIDGVSQGTGDTTSPYSFSWNTTGLTGSHSISARAYDSASPQNSIMSATISVIVDNSDRTAPSTPTGVQASENILRRVTITWGASTDNVGVTGYRVYRNGTLLNGNIAANNRTYTDTTVSPSTKAQNVTYSYTVVAFDANNNNSNPSSGLNVSTRRLGDTNGQNGVNLSDISFLLTHYTRTSAHAEWNTSKAADFSNNNEIDITDLSIQLSNYDT